MTLTEIKQDINALVVAVGGRQHERRDAVLVLVVHVALLVHQLLEVGRPVFVNGRQDLLLDRHLASHSLELANHHGGLELDVGRSCRGCLIRCVETTRRLSWWCTQSVSLTSWR